MAEVGAETPIQTESKTASKPSLGKKDFEFAGNKVEVNFVRFSGEENPKFDPKKAAFLLTGWPMRADAKITWGQPAMLAEEFGVTTYEIDGRPKGPFKMNSQTLEIEGIRQFAEELEKTGVNEITLFGHSIGASKVVDLALSLQQRNPNLKINLVLINPAGLYPQNIVDIAKAYAGGGGINKETKNPRRISQDQIPVLIDLAASIYKDMKDTGLNVFKLWREQARKVSEFNANLTKIKSPVIVMVATDDPAFTPEGIFPQEQMDKITPLPQQGEDSRDKMARIGKARERYLKENVLPEASDVKVIVATKYANHIAFGVERPRLSSHIIARHFDRIKRTTK